MRAACLNLPCATLLRGSLHPLSIVAFLRPCTHHSTNEVSVQPTTQKTAKNPTDRQTDQVPDPDSGQVVPVREPTRNCTSKFACVLRPLFHVIGTRSLHIGAQGTPMSTLAARAFSNAKRAVGGSRWMQVRKIDHFLGLFFPVPSRVVCVRVC